MSYYDPQYDSIDLAAEERDREEQHARNEEEAERDARPCPVEAAYEGWKRSLRIARKEVA